MSKELDLSENYLPFMQNNGEFMLILTFIKTKTI